MIDTTILYYKTILVIIGSAYFNPKGRHPARKYKNTKRKVFESFIVSVTEISLPYISPYYN
jgi:hypothetical protein